MILVASNLPIAPRRKASRGVTLLRFSSTCFSWSNIVYCNIGFATKMREGNTPAKRAVGPSVVKSFVKVAKVDGFRLILLDLTEDVRRPDEERESVRCDVILVLITHIGLVIRTVKLPAIAPATMDSIVVSFFDVREVRPAACSK